MLPLLFLAATALPADEPKTSDKPQDGMSASTFSGLKLRPIGPALTSGRVVGFGVHPNDRSHYYVAAASGGVWKTTNAGTSWAPIFDDQGSYSIGYVTLDPKNPNTVWVGTGENNSQRSVGYGDGVYRSDDGGKTWKKVGLDKSEHTGKILIDPRNSDVVYVAAQGPLWGPGGDRGLYKSTDGGKTWKEILNLDDVNTGCTDVIQDPRNPDVLIAATYQRRRHVWTLINGGPGSALYKSTDAGKTWTKLKTGLPTVDLGRIGLAVAPSDPNVVYAIIEAADKKGGIFRSTDWGVTWEKRNDFDQQAQYYSHLVVDPKNADRLYVMSVYIQVSDDGGKTLRRLGEKWKHVDSHEIWIDPTNTDFYRVGCDGGIYESFDRGKTWKMIDNLPITQFYDVAVDESGPFYHVYGGTQDNFTLGGPARTRSANGITNADWFVVQDGDGFQVQVDPKDPNIVYAEAQYGVLVRFDRRTGQKVGIQPLPGKGEPPLRWNWDSALLLSPHSPTRLYFAANKVFKSDDRGDNWKAISGDLTRQLDRDTLEVFGKLWGADAVAKHVSTSFYGNITCLAESPRKEGLLYAGTDDGLIQVTENGGGEWRKIDKFPGVPERAYVSRLFASRHDASTVYAAFDHHKMADFKPYLLKSTDAGKTWVSIAGDLPERGGVLAFAEDHKDPNLLFCGTEFALYFSLDGGKKWLKLSGVPTISCKDIVLQRQMDDLVLGTFGRGFYVLDDYSLLRGLKKETLDREASLFAPRTASLYVPSMKYGLPGKAFLGEGFYTAQNPPFGATFTYFLKDKIKTRKEKRQDVEKDALKKNEKPPLPSESDLRAEAEEEAPTVVLTVTDVGGKVLRTLTGPVAAGFHRVSWDLRLPAPSLPRPRAEEPDPWELDLGGPLVMPGTYKVSLAKRVESKLTPLGGPVEFRVAVDGVDALPEADRKALAEFQQKLLKLQRAVSGTLETANDLAAKLDKVKQALDQTPGVSEKDKEKVRELIQRTRDILRALRGDVELRRRNRNTPMSVSERVDYAAEATALAIAKPTGTQQEAYKVAGEEFAEELIRLRKLIEVDLKSLEKVLDDAGAPFTPGRLPDWKEK